MVQRLTLQSLLEVVLGTRNVYFQPPSNLQMTYPCIVYMRDDATTEYANNLPYMYTKGYQVTHIGRDPDSPVPDKIARLPSARFARHYVAENLHHDVFNISF